MRKLVQRAIEKANKYDKKGDKVNFKHFIALALRCDLTYNKTKHLQRCDTADCILNKASMLEEQKDSRADKWLVLAEEVMEIWEDKKRILEYIKESTKNEN